MHVGVEYVEFCDFSFFLCLVSQKTQVTHNEIKMIKRKLELQKVFRPAKCQEL